MVDDTRGETSELNSVSVASSLLNSPLQPTIAASLILGYIFVGVGAYDLGSFYGSVSCLHVR